VFDASDLVVETIDVLPADSLEAAEYGHGMGEHAASCGGCAGDQCIACGGSSFLPESWDWADES
jgi:hypothetical protein